MDSKIISVRDRLAQLIVDKLGKTAFSYNRETPVNGFALKIGGFSPADGSSISIVNVLYYQVTVTLSSKETWQTDNPRWEGEFELAIESVKLINEVQKLFRGRDLYYLNTAEIERVDLNDKGGVLTIDVAFQGNISCS